MANRKTSFSEILSQSVAAHSEILMEKARLANRLAKRSHGKNRQIAYAVKSKALTCLVRKMPETVRIAKDIKLTEFVVVELHREFSGLHLSISALQGC